MKPSKWIAAAIGVLALGALAWGIRRGATGRTAARAAATAEAARPTSVVAATVARRDVPVYLDGLGWAQAWMTVTVRPEVDGRLDAVFFREGQAVRRGQVLAQIDPRPFDAALHQAEGALVRDRALLTNARINVDRDRTLVERKLIAQQQLDTDVSIAGQYEGAVQIDQANIETARINLDFARPTSPVDGVTGVRLVDPGNIVHASDPGGIVMVTQLDPIAVIFVVPQDELPRIAPEMARGKLRVEATSRDGATLLGTGTLETIDNQINQSTSTLRLKALFANPRHLLWPNQFVKARLFLATRRGALVAPSSAIQLGPDGPFAYVIGADGRVAIRPVEVEPPRGDLAIVVRGLAEGERVVVDGQGQLRAGTLVVARAPVPPAEGGTPAR